MWSLVMVLIFLYIEQSIILANVIFSAQLMDIIVDGEASETDSEEEFEECADTETLDLEQRNSTDDTLTNQAEANSEQLSAALNSNSAPVDLTSNHPNIVPSTHSTPHCPVTTLSRLSPATPLYPSSPSSHTPATSVSTPSPSLTLFEMNLRERNHVFSSQVRGTVSGWCERVATRFRLMGSEYKVSQTYLERALHDAHTTRSNLMQGANHLDTVLAFSLLPQR